MTDRLKDKCAIVMGGGQTPGDTIGNGRATSILFAREGARVVVADTRLDSAEETVDEIAKEGGAAIAVPADATCEDDCRRVVETCVSEFGRVDVLHNNVGIGGADAGPAHIEEDVWDQILAVNLKSVVFPCKAALPVMRDQSSGAIVNISSIQGIVGRAGTPGYTASKFGLRGLTKTAALEFGRLGVRVNSVHPGGVDTPLIQDAVPGVKITSEMLDAGHANLPIPRCGRPEDIAPTSLFLASDEAAYITGTELIVDGGMTCGYSGLERG